MINARKFISWNLGPSDLETWEEIRSKARLIKGLGALPYEQKEELVYEFVQIVENTNERLIDRALAASLLAHSFKELEIVGMKEIAKKLLKILKAEFVPVVVTAPDMPGSPRSLALCTLEGVELFFFRDLSCALFRIDPIEAGKFFRDIGPLVEGSEIEKCFENLRQSKRGQA
jgi:hypothetical protein